MGEGWEMKGGRGMGGSGGMGGKEWDPSRTGYLESFQYDELKRRLILNKLLLLQYIRYAFYLHTKLF